MSKVVSVAGGGRVRIPREGKDDLVKRHGEEVSEAEAKLIAAAKLPEVKIGAEEVEVDPPEAPEPPAPPTGGDS